MILNSIYYFRNFINDVSFEPSLKSIIIIIHNYWWTTIIIQQLLLLS
jgi:hypothetical protein